MNDEIDLRALIANNLICDEHDVTPCSICGNETINLIERPFENDKKWNRIVQTSYIESIFLHCSMQPIIRFKNNDHTIIVDGYNRFLAMKSFYNDELILDERGLKQLKFLSGKKYSTLSDIEKQYFSKCDPIKVLDYSYNNVKMGKSILNEDEEIEVEKYLYVIYNTGLRLLIEEMQKAQFASDKITSKIKQKIENDEEFMKELEALRFFNGKKKRNKIDNILLNCRLLIASTYSNMYNFCSTYNIETRIEQNYLPNIINVNKDTIYQDFIINVNQIYTNLVNTQKWNNYEILHSKPFLDATYWLISIIRKDKLSDPFKFDFMKYLEYFGEIEETQKNFNPNRAHYKKDIYNKYYVVAKYYEKEYGIDMSNYFRQDVSINNNIDIINSIEELHRKHFSFTTKEMKISDLLVEVKTGSHNVRPYYQRLEVMNTVLASRIIESILLGIKIPYILMCDRFENGNMITEIVDGQQRILSLLGFLQQPFMNELGEEEYSNKNGYTLKGLRILTELNGLKYESNKKENEISKDYINKIMNTKLKISTTSQSENSSFSAVDQYVRINRNKSIIKEDTYRMWSLTMDAKIIKYLEEKISKYMGIILPKKNKNNTAAVTTLKLSYLFYTKDLESINYSNYDSKRISKWLKEFNEIKDKYMYKDIDIIKKERQNYLDSIDETLYFYEKIELFLTKLNKTLRDLVAMSNYAYIPLSNYYYLFCMLRNISTEDLIDNSNKIYNIINEFFEKVKVYKLDRKSIPEQLEFSSKQISVFNINKRYEFKTKLDRALQNN